MKEVKRKDEREMSKTTTTTTTTIESHIYRRCKMTIFIVINHILVFHAAEYK